MDRDPQNSAGESTARNREHVENAAENRDALAAQARRTEATAPASTDAPVARADAAAPAQDRDNAAAMREVEENRDALEAQNRRVQATSQGNDAATGAATPDDR